MSISRVDFRRRDEWGEPIAANGWRGYIPRGLPVSYSGLILLACIVVFLINQIYPPFVHYYLALNPDYVMQMPWTLITYMFVHADFNHLFWNMLFLFFFAMELERRVGESKFLQIYILSGIVAALGQMMISSGSMVGASGALFGVLGCLAVDCPRDSHTALLRHTDEHSWSSGSICCSLISSQWVRRTTIAHMAHIVGLLVGLAYGQAMRRSPGYY